MPLTLEIVTPEEKLYLGSADSVVLPTRSGEVGILPGHLPLITMVEPGELVLTNPGPNKALPDGHEDRDKPGPNELAVDKGFVRVLGDVVSVLTEAAINVEEIDLSKVEEAEERAKKSLEEARKKKDIDPAEIEKLEQITRFALAQRLAKGRRR